MTATDNDGTDLAKMVGQYLQMRHNMGYKLRRHRELLMDFVEYLDATGAAHLTSKIAVEWASLPADGAPRWWHLRLDVVRAFARYLQAFDPRTQVPEASLLPDGPHRVRPYIFSDQELQRLLVAADQLTPSFRALTYRTYISLVAVTGMRRSETTGLDCADIDWGQGILTIRQAKFHKWRQLPLHPSTVTALQDYARQRELKFPSPKQPAFFLSARGTRLLAENASQVFALLVRRSSMPVLDRRHQQHLHDLRHTFAVKTLQGWYRSRAEPGPLLPLLSTYLGHQDPAATYWYLSATPELMGLVSERVRSYLQEEP